MRIEIDSCEDCPFNIDPDPYPMYCTHPKAKQDGTTKTAELYKGKSNNCPLAIEPVIIIVIGTQNEEKD